MRRLAEEKRIAERAVIAKSRFLAAASHDLRQPLHAMGLFLSALRQREHNKKKLEIIDDMSKSSEDELGAIWTTGTSRQTMGGVQGCFINVSDERAHCSKRHSKQCCPCLPTELKQQHAKRWGLLGGYILHHLTQSCKFSFTGSLLMLALQKRKRGVHQTVAAT